MFRRLAHRRVAVAEFGGDESGALDLQDGQVGVGIGSHDLAFEFLAVVHHDAEARGTVDHMIVGQDIALLIDNNT